MPSAGSVSERSAAGEGARNPSRASARAASRRLAAVKMTVFRSGSIRA
jgi:hypothetical protein